MTPLASLPMYDLPEVRKETDALWELLASHMRRAEVEGVPDTLNRDEPYDAIWSKPNLLISQTCGLPLMRNFRRVLRPLATPKYRVAGCKGAEYSSAVLVSSKSIIASLDELRGKICAVNSPQSQSGYNALRAMAAPMSQNGRFFSEVKITGSHPLSMAAVAGGEADVCAVDCVTYALLARYRQGSIEGTRILGFTPGCHGLPIVVRADLESNQVDRIRSALQEAMADPAGEEVRGALFIDGITETEIDDYRAVLDMEARADALGYTELR